MYADFSYHNVDTEVLKSHLLKLNVIRPHDMIYAFTQLYAVGQKAV